MQELAVDKEGFLRKLADWSPEAAQQLAAQDGITLTPAHWELIDFVRDFHQRYNLALGNRALVQLVKQALGPDKGNSIYLMKLFTGKPAKALARIAGLPKPDNCD